MAPTTQEPIFVVLKHRLTACEGANILGRVIHNYQDPTYNYTPASPREALTAPGPAFSDFLLNPQYDYNARLTAHATQSSSHHLKFLTHVTRSTTSEGNTSVISPCVTTRRLKLEADYLSALKSLPDVRRKLLKMCTFGSPTYLVVGTMSAESASIQRTARTQRAGGGGVAVPLALAASAATAVAGVLLPVPGELLPDAEAGVNRANSAVTTAAFRIGTGEGETAAGREEVFAIACKVIRRSLASLGVDVRVQEAQPLYEGAQHFGGEEGDDLARREEDLGEEEEALLVEGLELEDWLLEDGVAEVLMNEQGDVVAKIVVEY